MREKFQYILKLISFVFIIPFVVGGTVGLSQELMLLNEYYPCFIWGMVTYVVIHLFVFEPQVVFQLGRGFVEGVFKFSPVLVNVLRLTLPFYTTVLFIVLYAMRYTLKLGVGWTQIAVFFIALTATMHVVLTARELYEEDSMLLKPNYFLMSGLVYIFAAFWLVLGLSFAFPEISAVQFFRAMAKVAMGLYTTAFIQLFVVR